MQGVAQTQDLLQAVWQQNYHGFSDYVQDEASLNPQLLLPPPHTHHNPDILPKTRTTSLWNYHQQLMQDTFHSFGASANRKPMISSASVNSGFIFDPKNDTGGFSNVSFPPSVPTQPSSRMPPPFPNSFGKLTIHVT